MTVADPNEKTATYSVGDYVYAIVPKKAGTLGCVLELARIASTVPQLNLVSRHVYWQVYIRRPKAWTPLPLERRVAAALSPAQVAHNRRLGLIPQLDDLPLPGERLS